MGGFVSLGVADAIGIYQNWHYGVRGEAWNKIDYEMSQQGFLIDLLNTVREEIRDQVTVIISSLDNMMLVSTLMFGIGFAFAVEGIMPPEPERQDSVMETALREVYTILVACSLVLPFWCLVFTLRIRYEVDICLGRHMEDLQQQLVNILMKNTVDGPGGSSPQLPIGSSTRLRRKPSFSDGIKTSQSKVWKAVRRNIGTLDFHEEVQAVELRTIARWAKEDLPRKLKNYDFYYPLVQLFLWMSMLSIILTSTVVIGLNMLERYSREPWMWMTYVVIVGVNAFLSMLFVGHMFTKGEVTSAGARAWEPILRQESPLGTPGYGTMESGNRRFGDLSEAAPSQRSDSEEQMPLFRACANQASPSGAELPASRFHAAAG